MDISIVLNCSKQEFFLGEDITIDVAYRNDNDSNYVFRDPARTWEVMLHVQKKTDNLVHRFPFGKIITKTDPVGIISQSREPAENINIQPKDMYTFYPSTCRDQLNVFDPGIYTLKVIDRTDDDVTRISNEFEIIVKATESSFEMLLAICTDKRYSQDNREFAVDWLSEFNSDFEYSVSSSTEEDDAQNKKMISDIRVWWHKCKNTPEVKEKFFLINKQAGVVKKNELC